MDSTPKPLAFETPRELRAWFLENHLDVNEVWIRLYRLDSGNLSVTYPEALEEALCVGWIDGIRKRLDEASYVQRFTPRKPRSYWSTVNIRRAEALIKAGRMLPKGVEAFKGRDASAARRYSFENRPRDLPANALAALKRHEKAWSFWRGQPPSYRRAVAWWVVSAKKKETRARRIALLVEFSRKGERIPPLTSPARGPR